MRNFPIVHTSESSDNEDDENVIGCLPSVLSPVHQQEINIIVESLPDIISSNDINAIENNLERYCKLLKLYQEQPVLLDGYIPVLVEKLLLFVHFPSTNSSTKTLPILSNVSLEYLEHLTTVRGAKVISRLLPHDVSYLDKLLTCMENLSPVVEDGFRQRRMLLLWLWIVCKNPFDMRRFDKRGQPGSTLTRIFNVVQPYLTGMLSKCHYMAALVLSQCIARTDGISSMSETIQKCISSIISDSNSLGGLILLAAILKHVDRRYVEPYIDELLTVISPYFSTKPPNVLFRKFLVKTAQRIALSLLKPRIASWRYRRGKRLLETILSTASDNNGHYNGFSNGNEPEDINFEVPEKIDWIIGCLLDAIKDEDTTVRWSAAKGIGRICSRLPQDMASQVVNAILDSNFHRLAGHCSWHGGCMSLAELSRRGFLLPDTLPKVFAIVQEALFYEEPMGRQALGANVRDAACYVLWSFARAYEPEDLRCYIDKVATNLMCVTLFDREVRLRRAASAAFQENVGRQSNFPDGIPLLTIVDYFAVGNRENCYIRLAKEVSLFSKYSSPIIDHLIEKKTIHWDITIRQQAALALFHLASRHADYISAKLHVLLEGSFSDNPVHRHGCIYALAHSIKGLVVNGYDVSFDFLNSASDLPIRVKSFFTNLRSGETTRLAVCEFIKLLSEIAIRLNEEQVKSWLSLLEIANVDRQERVRHAAVMASSIFFKVYVIPGTILAEEITAKIIKEIKNAHIEVDRQGYCSLAGCLQPDIIDDEFFFSLCDTILQPTPIDRKWALARQAAITAVCNIILSGYRTDWALKCFEVLFCGMKDYTMDIHGDIGRYVRQQSMCGLANILTNNITPEDIRQHYVQQAVKKMVQQSAEKIGRTRETACDCILQLLHHGTKQMISHSEILTTIYKNSGDFIQDKTLLNLAPLLDYDEYYEEVVEGLVYSAGGISEVTGRYSNEVFLAYQESITNDLKKVEKLVSTIADLFERGMKVLRIGDAVLRFLPQLLRRLPNEKSYIDGSQGLNSIVRRLESLLHSSKLSPMRVRLILNSFSSLLLLSPLCHIWQIAMTLLAGTLSHPMPIIRRSAAESLLESIWTSDIDEKVVSLLSETPWQDTENLSTIFEAASSIQNILVKS